MREVQGPVPEPYSIQVKICGLTDEAAVAATLQAGADLAGFVFFPPSPRHLATGRAAELAKPLRGRARIVALTVDADDRAFDDICTTLCPDLLQLHGDESPKRVAALKARYRLPVMKMIAVRDVADIERARAYFDVADRILFDAKAPPGASRPGGLGLSFDWRLLAGLDLPLPFMLSGGLDPDTVATAIRIARPGAVDVSSGVESAPGRKDPAAIRSFVDAVRAVGRETVTAGGGALERIPT
ncbi:phosphoribosylanthranilate isomerase [Microbaculum marinum]|uniref:N-(5'-phosphoribosyl)anthranilate isomerase n=1 Tax=Microbaculum marinum TaxID=1764581 RepID=A0AAW9RQK1_9HYPH